MKDLSHDAFKDCPYEVDPCLTPSDNVNNDLERKIDRIHGDINGSGGFDCGNNDYFEGQFFGSVYDRHGYLTKITSEDGCYCVGKWTNGLMEDIFDLTETDGWKRARYQCGLKHGLERKFHGTYPDAKVLQRVAFYCNDSISGTVWQFLAGGAILVGQVDRETELFSGRDVIYIYPDLFTAIIGRYDNGILVSGFMCNIQDVILNQETYMLEIMVENISNGTKVKMDLATSSIISKFPLVPDLWEAKMVEVCRSGIGEHAGQGLYLRKDVKSGQIVSLFNGIRCQSSRNDNGKIGQPNYDYRIRLNGEIDIDIPLNCVDLNQYCATLGHKANHSFTPNCKFSRLEHPRFGLIIAIRAIIDLEKGSEVLVNYGMQMAEAPVWYKSLWVKYLRETKCLSDDEIKDWCSRQYSMYGRSIDLPI